MKISKLLILITLNFCTSVRAMDLEGLSLIDTAKNGDYQQVHFLLKYGANPNAVDIFDATALMWAARWNHLDVVREFLNVKGINVNARDRSGKTALMMAAYWGHLDVVKELLKTKDININARDVCGDTALILAAFEGRLDIVREFVKYFNRLLNKPLEEVERTQLQEQIMQAVDYAQRIDVVNAFRPLLIHAAQLLGLHKKINTQTARIMRERVPFDMRAFKEQIQSLRKKTLLG